MPLRLKDVSKFVTNWQTHGNEISFLTKFIVPEVTHNCAFSLPNNKCITYNFPSLHFLCAGFFANFRRHWTRVLPINRWVHPWHYCYESRWGRWGPVWRHEGIRETHYVLWQGSHQKKRLVLSLEFCDTHMVFLRYVDMELTVAKGIQIMSFSILGLPRNKFY